MHRIIRVYSLLAVLLDPIVHVFLENTVYGVYTVHRIIRVYSMLSKEKGPYGATMVPLSHWTSHRPLYLYTQDGRVLVGLAT